MLATASVRIKQRAHRLSERGRLNGSLAVAQVPRFEKLSNQTTMWIVGLHFLDPVDGIATAKRQEWIAAPFRPLFETAKWPTVHEICRVLPTPAPDGQGRGEQLGPMAFYFVEQPGREFSLLRVLTSRV